MKKRVEVDCPSCGRRYELTLDLNKLRRLRPKALCGRCGERFDVSERLAAGLRSDAPSRAARRQPSAAAPRHSWAPPRPPTAAAKRPAPEPEEAPAPQAERKQPTARARRPIAVPSRPPAPTSGFSEPPIQLLDSDLVPLSELPPEPPDAAVFEPGWGAAAVVELESLRDSEPAAVAALLALLGPR